MDSVSDSVVRHTHFLVMVVRKEEARRRSASSVMDQERRSV